MIKKKPLGSTILTQKTEANPFRYTYVHTFFFCLFQKKDNDFNSAILIPSPPTLTNKY